MKKIAKKEVKKDIDMMRLMAKYNNEDACRNLLENLRWPDGVTCPRCQSKDIRNSYSRNQFDCGSCGYQFSVTSNTIFHDSHLPLPKWFIAIYMMIESKKGISANQMKRTLDVSYKTAWYLCHRIRAAMTEINPKPLSGIVEIDETWVGGKRQHVGHGYKGNKVVAAGAVERNGDTRLQRIDNRTHETLHNFIKSVVAPDAEAIYTDDFPTYKGIEDEDTRHESVNHSADEWVRGDVNTNSIENVFSLFKRSVMGSYHKVSKKHLDAYLDELEWRFNNRENPYLFRDTLLKLIHSENLEYKKLVT
jgi:transposase-like protein/IS1 family transposase